MSNLWEFGDVLCFGGGDGKFMFIRYQDGGSANVLVLDDPTPSKYRAGVILNFDPSTLKRVEAQPMTYREAVEAENPVKYWRLGEPSTAIRHEWKDE